ncbi:hypothetical protein LXA22_17430, partial [Erwinia amylovora]|uniref:hypothetical protein n=1 Tax=Erwinia amylovora TaxID=552 RepID=UPI0020C04A16
TAAKIRSELALSVFPALAGINRLSIWAASIQQCVPRVSGDKPTSVRMSNCQQMCSPRELG